MQIKGLLAGFIWNFGPEIDPKRVPDFTCYRPTFCPWLCDQAFLERYKRISSVSLVSQDSCYTLWTLARQALNLQGLFLECGVFKGGTARFLAEMVVETHELHLFDTFKGMPKTSSSDLHKAGDFADTSLEAVKNFVGSYSNIHYHAGFIPDTFSELSLNTTIAFAHIDVDIYDSVLSCCEYIYPRLVPGGIMLFDDYALATCPGARRAVDLYFASKTDFPLVIKTGGQALVVKTPTNPIIYTSPKV